MPDKGKIVKTSDNVLLQELTYLGLYSTISNILPYSSDRTAAQYKKIRMYPMCWLGLNFIKLGLASVPPVFEGDNQNNEKTITEAVFKRFWMKLITEALECLDFGWKPAEILWEHNKISYKLPDEETGESTKEIYEGLLLKSPKGLDPETIRILTDPKTGNFAGFEQYGISANCLKAQNKALVFSYMLESGNYYGISALEPIYPYWYDAQINRQFHMRWLERIGGGLLKGIYPEGATMVDGKKVDNQTIMLELLGTIMEGRVVSLPSKRDDKGNLLWDMVFLSDTERTDPFIARSKYIDECILRGLVIPEKAMTQGEIGARASVEAYQDLFMERKESLLDDVVRKIDEDLVQPFVKMNFGEEVEVHVSSGEFSDTSKETAGKIVEKLIDKDKVKVKVQWLVDKTSIPLEEIEPAEEPMPGQSNLDPNMTNVDPKTGALIDPNKDEYGKPIESNQNNEDEEDEENDLTPEEQKKADEEADREKKKTKKLSDMTDGRWRIMTRLERKCNLSTLDDYLNKISADFQNKLRDEVGFTQEKIITYLKKNYTADAKFVSILREIKYPYTDIRRTFREFLQDAYDYVYSNYQRAVEGRTRMASSDSVNQVIQFRIETTADKFTNDLMDSIKYQLSSDLGSKLALNDITDRIKNTTNNFLTDFKLSNTAETEIGFILGKAFEDYLASNLKAVAAGLIPESQKILRVRYSAIMDKNVCALCKKLDEGNIRENTGTGEGLVVPVDSFIRSKYDPPLHYMCRCVWLPVTQSDIDNPDIGGTDLTFGKKGKPLTADELTQILGDSLNLKLFSDHYFHSPQDRKQEVRTEKKIITIVNKKESLENVSKMTEQLKETQNKIDKLSESMTGKKQEQPHITIPVNIEVRMPESKPRSIKVKRDNNGKLIGMVDE